MKILAFSDLHRDQEAAHHVVAESSRADVVIGAGDFGTFCLGTADTLDILRAITVPTIIVSGNHDRFDDLRKFCSEWTNGHLLHGKSISIDGQHFFGLGCEVPQSSDAEWNQYLTEEVAAAALASCPQGAVLVTHSPPFGHCDLQQDGSHEGSHSIRDVIKMRRIKLHLCGHIHNAWGTTSTIEACPVHNLGPTNNWFEL